MTRLWLLTAALLALALASCGPDCERYCTKLDDCAASFAVATTRDHAQCVLDCNAVGSDQVRTIRCVIDTQCRDLATHCTPTGGQFPTP